MHPHLLWRCKGARACGAARRPALAAWPTHVHGHAVACSKARVQQPSRHSWSLRAPSASLAETRNGCRAVQASEHQPLKPHWPSGDAYWFSIFDQMPILKPKEHSKAIRAREHSSVTLLDFLLSELPSGRTRRVRANSNITDNLCSAFGVRWAAVQDLHIWCESSGCPQSEAVPPICALETPELCCKVMLCDECLLLRAPEKWAP